MDPYATLNIPRDASREEVRSAFVRVARSTHPDKARSASGAAAAFADVDEAWKILGDDQMREAYDEYGLAGTEALTTLRTASKGAVLSKRQLKDRVQLMQQVGLDQELLSRSTVRCHLTLVDLLNFLQGDWDNARIPGLSHVLVEQTTQFQATPKDIVTINAIAGSARRWAKPKPGVAAMDSSPQPPTLGTLTLTHTMMRGLNNFEYSFTCSAIRDQSPRVVVKGGRVIAKGMTGEIVLNADASSAGLTFSLSRYLTPSTVGHVQLGFGGDDGVGLGFRHEKVKHSDEQQGAQHQEANDGLSKVGNRIVQSNLQVQATNGLILMSTWSEPITKRSRFKTSFHLSLANIMLEIESSRSLNERSKLSGSLSIGAASGVMFKLKLLRGGNRYEFPILISPRISIWSTFIGGAVPMAIQYVVRRLLRPYRRRSRAQRRAELVATAKAARDRARNQMGLMKAASEAIRQNQQKSDGLVILLARYGSRLDEEYEWSDPELRPNIDVTVQLNFFVNTAASSLDLKEGSKVKLLGFYNPAFGSTPHNQVWGENDDAGLMDDEHEDAEDMDLSDLGVRRNKLFVRYLFRGMTYEHVYHDESKAIHLPDPDAVRVV